jgi:hypothetical protein
MKESKAKKYSKAKVLKINKSEKNRAAAQLVKTGSKIYQTISSDEQKMLNHAARNKDVEELLLSSTEDEEDSDLQQFIFNVKNLKGEELHKFLIEDKEKEAKKDKKYNEWIEPVLKKQVILENILASHDPARNKGVKTVLASHDAARNKDVEELLLSST